MWLEFSIKVIEKNFLKFELVMKYYIYIYNIGEFQDYFLNTSKQAINRFILYEVSFYSSIYLCDDTSTQKFCKSLSEYPKHINHIVF